MLSYNIGAMILDQYWLCFRLGTDHTFTHLNAHVSVFKSSPENDAVLDIGRHNILH